MYNTWDIACNIFPFWAGLMLWLIYLLFRGEKPSKELVVSTWKEFYSKCYELENREKISETKQNRFLIGTFCENISKNAIKNTYLTGLELEMKLRSEGKWIERDLSKGRPETDYSKVPKTEKGFDHIANIPNRNYTVEGKWIEEVDEKKEISQIKEKICFLRKNDPHRYYLLEGYKAFKESKKEVVTKPLSLIPETTNHYDIELVKNSKLEYKPIP